MSLVAESIIKSKMMKDLSLIISMEKSGDKDLAYKQFYRIISTFSTLKPIIKANLSFEEFKKISRRLSAFGLSWENGYYVPLAVFTFLKPLAFVIDNKEAFLKSSHEELLKIWHEKFF